MGSRAEGRRYTCRRPQFGTVALAVIERKAMAGETLLASKGKYGSGIESTGKQDDSGFHGRMVANPAV